MFTIDFDRPQWAHFMGIGGISMSSLAQFLLTKGFRVSGSDVAECKNTLRLRGLGAEIKIPQVAENIVPGIDFCVNTAAVHPDNPEYQNLLAQLQSTGDFYERYSNVYRSGFSTERLLFAICAANACLGPLCGFRFCAC